MGHKRLFLKDLTDEHLTWLKGALDCSPQATMKDWCEGMLDGTLAVYEVPGGLVGLKRETKQVFVEFICGKNMKPHAREILEAVRDLAGGQPVEGFVVHPGLARFYQRLGFKPTGTYMRLG